MIIPFFSLFQIQNTPTINDATGPPFLTPPSYPLLLTQHQTLQKEEKVHLWLERKQANLRRFVPKLMEVDEDSNDPLPHGLNESEFEAAV
jgi:hypothetical protein